MAIVDSPEVVLLQEVEQHDVRRFSRALAHQLQTRFIIRWVDGDNAVLFEAERFRLSNERNSHEAPTALRWASWGQSARCDEHDRGQIAVRLWDRRARQSLVVASVRWTHKTADACTPKNLWSLDRELERRWPRRPLTIVGGDFNTAADKRVVRGATDAMSAGREADPDCWYRAFTPLLDDATERETSAGPGHSRCRGVGAPNSYYDTVSLASSAEDEDAICNQWTYSKNLRARTGTSCTDINADGKRDRSRIDYIWVRWEGRDGRPVTLSLAEATTRVELARADDSWSGEELEGNRYSDHRATYATVRYGSDA